MISSLIAKKDLIEANDGKVYAMRSIMTFGFPLDIPGGKRHASFLDDKED